MSYLKDREVWLEKTPTGNPPAGYYWKFIQDGVVVVRDSAGVDRKMNNQDTDTFVLTTNFTGAADPVSANLARFTHVAKIGTGMSVASGRFTFPRTGIWRVELKGAFITTSDNLGLGVINVITDASGTPVKTERATSLQAQNVANGDFHIVLNGLEVTNVADIKVEFALAAAIAGITWQGNSAVFRTGMIFTRIGDL